MNQDLGAQVLILEKMAEGGGNTKVFREFADNIFLRIEKLLQKLA